MAQTRGVQSRAACLISHFSGLVARRRDFIGQIRVKFKPPPLLLWYSSRKGREPEAIWLRIYSLPSQAEWLIAVDAIEPLSDPSSFVIELVRQVSLR